MRIRVISFLVIGLLTSVFFWKTLFAGLLPIPSDTLVGLYHPWRDSYASVYERGVPFRNFLITDPIRQQIPWRNSVADALKKGSLPGWDPSAFSGMPLDANIQAAPFYPLNVLLLFMPFEVAWSVLVMIQPFLAGIFMYLYLKKRLKGNLSALWGGVAWMFSGFSVAWLTWGTIMQTIMWLPFLLYAADCLMDDVRGRSGLASHIHIAVLMGAGMAMMATAGHAQVALYAAVVFLAYVLLRFVFSKESGVWNVGAFLLADVVALPLLVLQAIPMIRFISMSPRLTDAALWREPGWFMPISHLVQFLAPDFFGNPATMNYWGVWNYGEFIGYMGPAVILLSLVALLSMRNRFMLFWSGMLVISLLFATDNPVARLPYIFGVPLLSSLQPTRLLSVTDLSLGIMSAYGLSVVLTGRAAHRRLLQAILSVGVLYVFLWIGATNLCSLAVNLSDCQISASVARRNLMLPTAVFLISAASLYLSVWRKRLSRFVMLILLVVMAADLIRFGWKFTPFTPVEYLYPETAIISELRNLTSDGMRVMSVDDRAMPPNVLSMYGIPAVDGYDSLYPARYEELLGAIGRGSPDISRPFGFNRMLRLRDTASRLLPLFSVGYVVSMAPVDNPSFLPVMEEGETRLYEYAGKQPILRLAQDVHTVKKKEDALEFLFSDSFVPGYQAVVEHDSRIIVGMPSEADSIAFRYLSDTYEATVSVSQPRLVVLSVSWHPGWTARIDGQAVPVYHTDYAFMGAVVPPGTHTLTFTYGKGIGI